MGLNNPIKGLKGVSLLTILANGPSLKEDLGKIDFSKGDFLVLNDFYKFPEFVKIRPLYYVLADPYYFETEENIKNVIQNVNWSIKLFIPSYALRKKVFLKTLNNSFVEIIPYNTATYMGFERLKNKVYRAGLAMPKPQNVLVPSIFIGINMGYSVIKLYGVDHSWTESIRVNENNEVCLTDSHFYDTEEVQLHPWHKATGEQYKMHEVLRDLAQMFDSYHQLSEYAKYRGCRILNCSRNSFIDAFERA